MKPRTRKEKQLSKEFQDVIDSPESRQQQRASRRVIKKQMAKTSRALDKAAIESSMDDES